MCRFVMYTGPEIRLSSLITEPSHSLVNQSVRARERSEPLNGDGFGVAWYPAEEEERPAVFRSISPAWSNMNLQDLCRVTRTSCVLAHVRAASPGLPVTETNCHPFTAGRFTFMHNGNVAGFRRRRRAFVAAVSDEVYEHVEGTTDSEHVFALFLDRMKDRADDAGGMAEALEATIRDVVELADPGETDASTVLNLAVSNGRESVATRFTTREGGEGASLYVHHGGRYTCEDGVCHMDPDARGATRTAIVSSEPLSEDGDWQRVPRQHRVEIGPDGAVVVAPLRV